MSLQVTDPKIAGMGEEVEEEEEEMMQALEVSSVTSDGFQLLWNVETDRVYDSYIVEYRDTLGLWDKMEVWLPGDSTGTRLRGLRAATAYQIKLYGITGGQISRALEAVAKTGIYTLGLEWGDRNSVNSIIVNLIFTNQTTNRIMDTAV